MLFSRVISRASPCSHQKDDQRPCCCCYYLTQHLFNLPCRFIIMDEVVKESTVANLVWSNYKPIGRWTDHTLQSKVLGCFIEEIGPENIYTLPKRSIRKRDALLAAQKVADVSTLTIRRWFTHFLQYGDDEGLHTKLVDYFCRELQLGIALQWCFYLATDQQDCHPLCPLLEATCILAPAIPP